VIASADAFREAVAEVVGACQTGQIAAESAAGAGDEEGHRRHRRAASLSRMCRAGQAPADGGDQLYPYPSHRQ
jgi:hypothetical protein